MEVQMEWVLTIVVIVVGIGIMTYVTRKSIVEAFEKIASDRNVLIASENIVEAQPEPVQALLEVVHRQFDILEGLVRNAGLINTPVGRVLDKAEDLLEEATNNTPLPPPVVPPVESPIEVVAEHTTVTVTDQG